MPAPDVLAAPAGLYAYGPVPGVELIPYFLALLTWVALALGALFFSPIRVVVRLIRRPMRRPRASAAPATVPGSPSVSPPASMPEPAIDAPRTAS